MDFDGYAPLSLTTDEIELLKALRNMADRSGFEYGYAAQFSWVSGIFTSRARNHVDIPAYILNRQRISLYHAHTNKTLLSTQDLRLLLNPNIDKICVITTDFVISSAYVGDGYRPDDAEFQEASKYIGRDVDMELLDDPHFFEWTPEERVFHAVCEQSFRIARHFKWTMEGGQL